MERVLAVGEKSALPGPDPPTRVDSFEVAHEPNPGAAIEQLEEEDFTAVLVAAEVSGGDELSFVETVAETFPDLPIIYCSGGIEASRSALEAGATDVLRTEAGVPVLQLRLDKAREKNARASTYREQIESLHSVGIELAACESPGEVYELAVTAGEEILDLDLCAVGIVENERIQLRASSETLAEEGYREPRIDSPEGGHAAKAYRTGEAILTDDMQASPDANPLLEYRGAMTVPIGEFGVYQAVSYEVGAFDRTDLELTEILISHVEQALARLEQTARLERRSEQLARENERLEEFTSIVSHDLRNPLNVASLQLELLSEGCDSERLESALEALDRTEALIDDLLALAREGETVSEFETVRLDRTARGAWKHVETGSATLDVRTEAVIEADQSRLQQLLSNIFRNSIEHGTDVRRSSTTRDVADLDDQDEHEAGDLTVTVGATDGGFYVEDDGVGIPGEIREEVFESGVSSSDGGTGLGLAIANRIAEAHGWSIRATEADSGGARFEVTGIERAGDT